MPDCFDPPLEGLVACDPYKRWKDGPMKKRWVATGMLEAERSFRRVWGCMEIPVLVDALRRQAGRVRGSEYDEEAA
jgi:hypothetical protein